MTLGKPVHVHILVGMELQYNGSLQKSFLKTLKLKLRKLEIYLRQLVAYVQV